MDLTLLLAAGFAAAGVMFIYSYGKYVGQEHVLHIMCWRYANGTKECREAMDWITYVRDRLK
jgi:hypothetical protein